MLFWEYILLSLLVMVVVLFLRGECGIFLFFYNIIFIGSNEFMIYQLKFCDIIVLGFMIFVLFVGVGNIIFFLMVGLQVGEYVWMVVIGFLIIVVGLLVLMVVVLVKVGGGVESLSILIGKVVGILLVVVCYFVVGLLFVMLCIVIVFFEVGIVLLIGDGLLLLLIYSVIYFVLVILVFFYLGKLLDIVGNFFVLLKIIVLIVLVVVVIIWLVGLISDVLEVYCMVLFFNGFVNGYLIMDIFGVMVFGIVIVNVVCLCGVSEVCLLICYIVWVGLMVGVGLILLYLVLFCLGFDSVIFVDQFVNGVVIFYVYVQYIFGGVGSFLLVVLIFIVCLVMVVGLICVCVEFFVQYLLFFYCMLVFVFGLFFMVVFNLGFSYLIQVLILVLIVIYLLCIVLVVLSFICSWWYNLFCVIVLVMFISLMFGIIDGIKLLVFVVILLDWIVCLLLVEQGLVWLMFIVVMIIFVVIWDCVVGCQVIFSVY